MHLWMQCLHAAIEHLGKSSELGDVPHRQPRGAQGSRRTAGRDQLDSHASKLACESDEARLVGYGQQRAADARIARHSAVSSTMRSASQFTSVSPKVTPRSTICSARRGPALSAK